MTAPAWFVMVPPSYEKASTAEKEHYDFRVEYTDPKTIAAVEAGKIVSTARGYQDTGYGGQDLVKWQGPFATEAQALAAQNPQQQSANPVNNAVNAAENSSTVGNALSIPASIGNFFAALGEANTWIRVAKVIIGGALVLIGLAHMSGADNAVATAARRVPLPI